MSGTSAPSSTATPVLQRPWVLATLAVAAVGIGYAAFFDYKRRADPSFRRNLRKQRKRVEKKKTEEDSAKARDVAASGGAADGLEAEIEALLNEPLPTTPEAKEAFFMEQLSKGETLAKNGPEFFKLAAAFFYKALKVYPAPAELVMLYQKTLTEPVFNLVMGFISSEVKKRQEQYFVSFPDASMNVRVGEEPDPKRKAPDGTPLKRRTLIAAKDFEAGETIYEEEPIVGTLNPAFLQSGEHCAHCFKPTACDGKVESTRTGATYCSKACEDIAWETYESLLFADYARPGGSTTTTLVAECATDGVIVPLHMARFLAYMVHEDTKKAENPDADGFGVWDHIERLRYLELTPTAIDAKYITMLQTLLGEKVPGLEDFLTLERYLLLKGKFLYNQMAVATRQVEALVAAEAAAEAETTAEAKPEEPAAEEAEKPTEVIAAAADPAPELDVESLADDADDQQADDSPAALLEEEDTSSAIVVEVEKSEDDESAASGDAQDVAADAADAETPAAEEPAAAEETPDASTDAIPEATVEEAEEEEEVKSKEDEEKPKVAVLEPERSASAAAASTAAALYPVSAYLTHSCTPNVEATFPRKSRTLALVAKTPVRAGDVLMTAFVDLALPYADRKAALGAGWRYTCECGRCAAEAPKEEEAEEEAKVDE
ncbi:hypothetical protein AMAG_04388 [Allomyces macrogynus ATCC 38327]|uniref:Uncharacterized protein n=1 Tax=Allomyces macrogynus (strain ATCC 38327) TaxID=578462 RepID=A0A0L0S8P3_ALLM3|nr:hypothetical protein AMAG_04388 [Allomyces macrogynus ATCC 38327]|eukprot:KNE58847.1 hypothetical protein AMAG_04388 [Allomyces macrogynus ATCC 38327]